MPILDMRQVDNGGNRIFRELENVCARCDEVRIVARWVWVQARRHQNNFSFIGRSDAGKGKEKLCNFGAASTLLMSQNSDPDEAQGMAGLGRKLRWPWAYLGWSFSQTLGNW